MTLVFPFAPSTDTNQHTIENRREIVFLLHGFAGKPFLLSRMARHLVHMGYDVRNWAYPTVFNRIEGNSQRLRKEIEELSQMDTRPRIHVVTHSLGGIVARLAFMEDPPGKLGRVVMLAPPNQGSHLARFASKIFGGLCPVLSDLSDQQQSFVNRLGQFPPLEIGVIAASRDWVVSRRCTHLASQADHTIVSGSHVSLPFKAHAAQQVVAFLRHGRFLSLVS